VKRESVALVLTVALTVGATGGFLLGQYVGTPSVRTITVPNIRTVVIPCNGDSPLALGEVVTTNSNNASVVCVRFFYYDTNSNSTYKIDTLGYLSIDALANNGTVISAKNEFLLTADPEMISIGGPLNASEGVVVGYTIQAKVGTSGTFDLGFGWLAPQVEDCGHEFSLLAGSGEPDVSIHDGGCITMMNLAGSYPPKTVLIEPIFALNGTAKGS